MDVSAATLVLMVRTITVVVPYQTIKLNIKPMKERIRDTRRFIIQSENRIKKCPKI